MAPIKLGNRTRSVALLLAGVALGGLVPDVVTLFTRTHRWNEVFLAIGILGFVLTLATRPERGRK